jgi:hypothetical protein
MKPLLPILFLLALISPSSANEMVMRDFGTYHFKADGFDVTVDLKEVASDALAPKIAFRENGKEGSTGIGKDSSLAVVPGRWAAQFSPPYELWIYDGTDKLTLYERTIDPKGFKASSSNVVPQLLARVPAALKQLMHSKPENIQ